MLLSDLGASSSPLLPVGPTGVPTADPVPRLYQIVQETAVGPKFLTSWDTLEAAMRDCRSLNERTGNPFKAILWGHGTPCQMCSPRQRQFKKDNILPSFVYHSGGVRNYPEALPISAVYNHGTEVVFLPDGTGTATGLGNFEVSLSAIRRGPSVRYRYWDAIEAGKRLAASQGKRVFVHANVKSRAGGKSLPVASINPTLNGLQGLGDYSLNPIISPVTPDEFQELITMSQQYADTL
jgi:hypothetical protein